VTCSGSRSSQTSSLRREEYPRSSYRLSLRQDCDSGPGEFAGTRLGEAISPERDGFSLKKRFTRLSEYLRNTPGWVSTTLAWARWARLGENISSPSPASRDRDINTQR